MVRSPRPGSLETRDPRIIKRSASNESGASIAQGGAESRVVNPETTSDAPAQLFDCSVLMIHCKHHDRYALKEVSSRKTGLWFPFAVSTSHCSMSVFYATFSLHFFSHLQVVYKQAFEAAAQGKLKHLLKVPNLSSGHVPYKIPEIVHIFRLQIPYLRSFIVRYTFFVELESKPCCEQTQGLVWMTSKQMKENNNKMWGPEPYAFHAEFDPRKPVMGAHIQEYDLRDPKRLAMKGNKPTPSQMLVRQVGLDMSDLFKWYSEFIQHCWPSQAMSLLSFHNYMSVIGYYKDENAKKEAVHYFHAFGYEEQFFLNYREFILGLAASDRRAKMQEPVAEIRVGYIMRFYDFGRDKHLNEAEFNRLTADALKSQMKSGSKGSIPKEVKRSVSNLGIKPGSGKKINEKELAQLIGGLKIRGTSNLFRTNISITGSKGSQPPSSSDQSSNNLFQYKVIDETMRSMDDIMGRSGSVANRADLNKCPKCKDRKHTLASHFVKLTPTGFITTPTELDFEDVKRASKISRRNSNEFFSENLVNHFIDLIQEYSDHNKILGGSARVNRNRPRNYLEQIDRGELQKMLLKLCEIVEEIVKKEGRVLKVNSPCIVFGDIHGNLHDLMLYERLFWRKGAPIEAWNYLFLGDYVDRGHCSLEVAIYLFAMKCHAPNQFYILRGNHEVRSVNRAFTFLKELESKLGPQMGQLIWERFNQVFDCLPCCAVIDDKIFCAHGGIPSAGTGACKISDLYSLPCPLPNPEEQSVVTWEMLWNDPVNNQV